MHPISPLTVLTLSSESIFKGISVLMNVHEFPKFCLRNRSHPFTSETIPTVYHEPSFASLNYQQCKPELLLYFFLPIIPERLYRQELLSSLQLGLPPDVVPSRR
jgi:hypothetical protein